MQNRGNDTSWSYRKQREGERGKKRGEQLKGVDNAKSRHREYINDYELLIR